MHLFYAAKQHQYSNTGHHWNAVFGITGLEPVQLGYDTAGHRVDKLDKSFTENLS